VQQNDTSLVLYARTSGPSICSEEGGDGDLKLSTVIIIICIIVAPLVLFVCAFCLMFVMYKCRWTNWFDGIFYRLEEKFCPPREGDFSLQL
jgi:hypothetical protein